MSFSVDDYKHQLKSLLPVGALWESLKTDVQFDKLLDAEAVEFSRISGRAEALINETDPRIVFELLTEWEAFAGLPDQCLGELGTLEQRQASLHTRLTASGGQSKAYFIALALSIGYVITITEFQCFTVDDTVNDTIYGADWNFAWQINAPSETVTYFKMTSDVDAALANWGNELLECVINRLKPAHTIVLFAYGA